MSMHNFSGKYWLTTIKAGDRQEGYKENEGKWLQFYE